MKKITKKILSIICLVVLLGLAHYIAGLVYKSYISKTVFIIAIIAIFILLVILIKNNIKYILEKTGATKCPKCSRKVKNEEVCPSCGEKSMSTSDRKLFAVVNLLSYILIPIASVIWLDLIIHIIMSLISPGNHLWLDVFGTGINIY